MLNNIEEIVQRLKKDTNSLSDIIYRKKVIHGKKLYIIYNEPLTASDKISDFIVRSLNKIAGHKLTALNLFDHIKNDISNFKVTTISNYQDLCYYMHAGFTIILMEGQEEGLALETKADISRGITTPETENTLRGSKDAFIENYQINLGLIKRRIKTNDLWIENLSLGKYTNTQIGVLSIHGVVKPHLVDLVIKKLKKINISGILNSDMIKNLIEKENKSLFPTIMTTERPDVVASSLMAGKVAIVVDNSPYVLLVPTVMNDLFKTMEDVYGKSLNVTFTRILKFMAFWIALLTPAIYISLITYNQEMVPTDLLVSFATQRDGVPFPAFFEAFLMMISFEILREADLRVPSFSGSALSIVGALILGEAAVSAGIVSPIMIIVIALTAISSLPFNEAEMINALRWYRILFMLGGSILGVIGVLVVLIGFITKLASTRSFGTPYLAPYAPIDIAGLKNSFIKFPLRSIKKRPSYLSNNKIQERSEEG